MSFPARPRPRSAYSYHEVLERQRELEAQPDAPRGRAGEPQIRTEVYPPGDAPEPAHRAKITEIPLPERSTCSTCAYWRHDEYINHGTCTYMASSQGMALEDKAKAVAFPDDDRVWDLNHPLGGMGALVKTDADFGCDAHPDRRGLSPEATEAG